MQSSCGSRKCGAERTILLTVTFALLGSSLAQRCGSQGFNISCGTALCCSKDDYCGITNDYCGNGCQSSYGNCSSTGFTAPAATPECSNKVRCDREGAPCCSKFGYCGSTSDYCGTQCVSGCPDAGEQVDEAGLSVGAYTGIGVGIVSAPVIVVLLWYLRRRVQGKRKVAKSGLAELAADYELPGPSIEQSIGGKVMGMRYTYESINDATNGFSKELGRGAYGVVYKGILTDGSEIAVKKLTDNQRGLKDFEAEIKTLGSINHANLVALRGFCIQRNQPLVVYEYVINGSLDKWIFSSDKILPWQTRVDIAKGTAKGLAYLHGELQIGQAIIHLDIKPENILLDEKFVPKVADFGMAKLIGQTRTQTIASGGTFGYMAPEVYAGSATSKMDVYSFGIVLLELVAGRRHLDHSLAEDSFFLPALAVRKILLQAEVDVVDPKLEGDFDVMQARVLIAVALLCLQRDPDDRPDMGSVYRMVEGIKAPNKLPPNLQQELEMTERLVRKPTQALGWKADADSFFIDFGSDRSYRMGQDVSSNVGSSAVSTDSAPPNMSNTPLLR